MKPLSRPHKRFIELYTTPGQPAFLNATESYRRTYPKSSDDSCECNSVRLMKREDVKKGIERGLEPVIHLSKGDYIKKVEEELQTCTSPAVRARLLELIGKVHSFTRDNEVSTTVNTISINDLREVLDARQGMLEGIDLGDRRTEGD